MSDITEDLLTLSMQLVENAQRIERERIVRFLKLVHLKNPKEAGVNAHELALAIADGAHLR